MGKSRHPSVDRTASVAIEEQLVLDAAFAGERLVRLGHVQRVDTDEADPIAELGLHLGERRELLLARLARGVPEVDHQRLAEQLVGGDGFTVVGEEIDRRAAGRRRPGGSSRCRDLGGARASRGRRSSAPRLSSASSPLRLSAHPPTTLTTRAAASDATSTLIRTEGRDRRSVGTSSGYRSGSSPGVARRASSLRLLPQSGGSCGRRPHGDSRGLARCVTHDRIWFGLVVV